MNKKHCKTPSEVHSIWMKKQNWDKIRNVSKQTPLSTSKFLWELFRQYYLDYLENNKIDASFLKKENI
jgi:hypothetical protein